MAERPKDDMEMKIAQYMLVKNRIPSRALILIIAKGPSTHPFTNKIQVGEENGKSGQLGQVEVMGWAQFANSDLRNNETRLRRSIKKCRIPS